MKKLLSSILLCSAMSLMAITNEEVSIKAYGATGNYVSELAELEMLLRNSNGATNKRDLIMKKLEGKNGDKTLLEFRSPADVKGTMLLTHEHLGKADSQWLYLPSLKRTKRIVSKNKSGAFMGSEFSYEDLSGQHFNRFSYSGNAENVKLNGVKVYKSVRTPKDDYSGYSKEIIWVEPKNFLIQRIDYFDKRGNFLKTALMPKYTNIKGIWRVSKIIMKNVQTKKETILNWKSEKIKVGLKNRDFSQSIFL